MEDNNLKILLGASDPLPEVDEEENDKMAEEAIKDYEMMEVLNAIGGDDFKIIYHIVMQEIRQYPIEDQFKFCREILYRITEEYNFEFPWSIDLLTEDSVNQIYILIEFIEFNHVKFFAELMKPYNFDFRNGNVKEFIELNYTAIERDIEVISRNVPKIISEFLRTYNKDDMVNWLVSRIEKSRMMILLTMKEGELT